jgi:hypothetical protein
LTAEVPDSTNTPTTDVQFITATLSQPGFKNMFKTMTKAKPQGFVRLIRRSSSIGCLLFALAVVAIPPALAFGDEILNNGSVIEMQKLNLGDGVIIDKIRVSQCNFDTSLDGLKALKAANVSDAVIQAMLAKTAPPPPPPATGGIPIPANVNDPAAPHPPGIWRWVETNGVKTLSQMDRERTVEISRGGFIGPFGAGKISTTARLTGMSSPAQLSERKPEFYLYIGERDRSDLMVDGPNDLIFCQFTVIPTDAKRNANQRAVDIATYGAYGSSHGIDKKALREFDSRKVGEGIYKIVPKGDLADGEYAFCSAPAASAYLAGTSGRFYTFGIHTK